MVRSNNKKALTATERAEAQRVIDSTSPGIYTLANLYRSRWKTVANVHAFGIRFKESVRRELLPGIEYYQDTGAHAAQYVVRGNQLPS